MSQKLIRSINSKGRSLKVRKILIQ